MTVNMASEAFTRIELVITHGRERGPEREGSESMLCWETVALRQAHQLHIEHTHVCLALGAPLFSILV